jgi:NAD(P)-dependent dehydrogenase (short-subunit alcohol dehydrogenase family)
MLVPRRNSLSTSRTWPVADKNYVLVTGGNTGIGYEICKETRFRANKLPHPYGNTLSPKRQRSCRLSLRPQVVRRTDSNRRHRRTTPSPPASPIIEKQFGRLDVLVNNAGIDGRAFANTSMPSREDYYGIFDTNAFGGACLTDACIPLLKKAKVPRIVFVSSSQGSLTRTLEPS